MVDAGLGFVFTSFSTGRFKIPPLFVNAEYALPPIPLSVGLGVSSYQWESSYVTETFVSILARANWHWGIDAEWLDLYTGLSLGYIIDNEKVNVPGYDNPKLGKSGFDWGIQIGAHFYFSKFIGAMVELGYPYLKGGIALKF